MHKQTVLLDLDGTIRDTADVIYEAIEHSFRTLGSEAPSRDDMRPYAHYHDHVRAKFLPDVTTEQFEAVYIPKGHEGVLHAPLYDGIRDAIVTLKEKGYLLAIVSSAIDVPGYLKEVKLSEYFDAWVGAADVTYKKPHPEPVLTVLERLGVEVDDAIMVGDLAADIESAKAAGVTATIGVTYGMGSRETLEAAGAEYIIDSSRELLDVIEKVEQQHD